MTSKLCIIIIALISMLAQTAPAAAQQLKGTGDWAAVQSLSPGEKIVVRLKDGNRLTGRFESASDLNINFTDNGRKVSLTRDSIQRVQINRGKSRLKGALVGAAVSNRLANRWASSRPAGAPGRAAHHRSGGASGSSTTENTRSAPAGP